MSIQNGIAIIHGNKLESLVNVVEHWIKTNPLPVLENDVFLIYNNGVGQWLKQHFAKNASLGIASGLEVKLPSIFVWNVYRSVLGQQIPKEQPLAKNALIWRLFRLLPDLIEEPIFNNLAHFLTDDKKDIKRHQLAEKLAELFDQYQMYRADWLIDWENGKDVIRDGHNVEKTISEEYRWQTTLWRRILDDVKTDSQFASRSSVHELFINEIAKLTKLPSDLPKRIIVLGIPTLPQQHIEVLSSISRFCQIVLCVTNPCQHYWADIIEDKDLLKAEQKRQRKKAGIPENISEEHLHLYANPLLAAWGKQGRDYIRLLDYFDEQSVYQQWHWANNKIDFFEDYAEDENACLLQKLQQSILNLDPIPKEKKLLNTIDSSLEFHIAHSPQREVEILHDQLLARFNENTTLKPRDVLVMVPDINKYAPHIHAVFGQVSFDDKRYIPYSVTDQQERGQNSLIVATEFLLTLPHARFTASQVRWLLEIPAIRNRFEIEAAIVPKLCQWIEGAQIRWGLNDEHRQKLGMMQGLDANTWQFGLNRMLLGYAVGKGEAFANIEPYEEIGGLEAQWLGNLCFLIETLEKYAMQLDKNCDYETWLILLNSLLNDFFKPSDERERKTLETLENTLKKWGEHCKQANLMQTDTLSLEVVCESWLSGVDEPNFQKIFLSGKVNFCTLMPMRSIPFTVICILGMNDGEYPRPKPVQNFDLMNLTGQYRPGDRSRRQDDQYVFLEALLSARQQFYISWIGRNVRDNNKIPPSVLISQLRETIERSWHLAEKNLLDEITLEHPLQPFSWHYLENNQHSRLFTYSREWFQASLENETQPILEHEQNSNEITLESLSYFLKSPVKTYCNQILKFYLTDKNAINVDNEPFDFNRLEEHQFKDILLKGLKNNMHSTQEDFFQHKQTEFVRKGLFPLGNFANLRFEQLSQTVKQAWNNYDEILENWRIECEPLPVLIDFELNKKQIFLSGFIRNLRQNEKNEHAIIVLTPQSLKSDKTIKYHNFCQHWVNHLAACSEGLNLKTFIIGVDCVVFIHFINDTNAKECLIDIVKARTEGLTKPLPIAIQSCFSILQGMDAQKKYEGDFTMGEVEQDAYLKRIFPTFDDLSQNGEFERWAKHLYAPMRENIKEAKS